MKNTIWVLAGMLSFLQGTGIFALPLENLLPETQVKQLMQSGAIDRERFDASTPGMVPRFAVLEKLLETNRKAIEPNIVVESLRLYKKPSSQAVWTASERTELFNGIIALSTLKGIEYFSKSRNKMHLLYESSVIIDGPVNKNPRPDPVFGIPHAELSVYVRKKDLTFGDNVYEATYYSGESSFIVLLDNVTALSYGFVTVVGKNKFKTVVAIFDCGPYLLVYAASMAKAVSLPGMNERVGNSFANRAEAVLHWFSDQADRAFKKVNS